MQWLNKLLDPLIEYSGTQEWMLLTDRKSVV